LNQFVGTNDNLWYKTELGRGAYKFRTNKRYADRQTPLTLCHRSPIGFLYFLNYSDNYII
jgi:hypothetical protein